jgi:hypothetical protein
VLRAIIRVGWFFGVCVLSSLAAFGQANVINPKVVEFDPSVDHSALTADGQPLVTRYDLQIFLQGATQPTTTTSLGKPAIETDGKIRVDFSTLITPWPLAGGTYQARVEAIGPAGAGESDPSNLFVFQAVVTPPTPAPCTYALSSTAQAAGAMGGAASVMVTTSNTTCAWAASSNASWVTVGPSSGTGSGAVSVTVAANTGAARTAKVTIGGLTYTVSQAAAPPCSFSLSPTSFSLSSGSRSSSVALTATGATCGWAASSNASWVTVGPSSGTGSGAVSVTVAANTGAARTAKVTIGGLTYTVSQAAAPPPCSFSLSPTSIVAAGPEGAFTVSLTASAPTCAWTAQSSANWITVGTTSGTGSASVTCSLSRNTSGASRTGTVTVGGHAVTVTQASLQRPTQPQGLKVVIK